MEYFLGGVLHKALHPPILLPIMWYPPGAVWGQERPEEAVEQSDRVFHALQALPFLPFFFPLYPEA